MKTQTVNISFPGKLLSALDKVACEESRSRSELLREAALTYLERKQRWTDILTYWEEAARKDGFTQERVKKEIRAYRKRSRQR